MLTSPKSAAVGEPRRVLLVDQSTVAAVETLPHVLKVSWTSELALSLDEATRYLDRYTPSLMLVDSSTLDMDTVGTLVAFRNHLNGAKVPIVLVTATHISGELLQVASRCGLDDALLKPLQSVQLAPLLSVISGEDELSAVPKSRAPKNVVLVGGDYRYLQPLGETLELCGHRLLYAAASPELSIRLRDITEKVDVVIADDDSAAALLTLSAEPRFKEALRIALSGRPTLPPECGTWNHVVDRSKASPDQVAQTLTKLIRPSGTSLQSTERVPFYCPVEFRETGSKTGWRSCFSTALNANGIFLKTLAAVRPGAPLDIKIHAKMSRDTIEGTGVVSWSNSYAKERAFSYPVGMGVQFLGMDPKRMGQLRDIMRTLSTSR